MIVFQKDIFLETNSQIFCISERFFGIYGKFCDVCQSMSDTFRDILKGVRHISKYLR